MVQKRLTGEEKDKVVIRKEDVCTELSSRAAVINLEVKNVSTRDLLFRTVCKLSLFARIVTIPQCLALAFPVGEGGPALPVDEDDPCQSLKG